MLAFRQRSDDGVVVGVRRVGRPQAPPIPPGSCAQGLLPLGLLLEALEAARNIQLGHPPGSCSRLSAAISGSIRQASIKSRWRSIVSLAAGAVSSSRDAKPVELLERRCGQATRRNRAPDRMMRRQLGCPATAPCAVEL